MKDGVDWIAVDKQANTAFLIDVEAAAKKGGAERDYFGAVRLARLQAENENLTPDRTEFGELRYTVQQGLRAACLAHEGTMAARDLQLTILKRLDRNRNYMAVVIILLICVANKL